MKGEITDTEAEVVFKNTKKPLVDISVSKEWKNQNGETYSGDFPEQLLCTAVAEEVLEGCG